MRVFTVWRMVWCVCGACSDGLWVVEEQNTQREHHHSKREVGEEEEGPWLSRDHALHVDLYMYPVYAYSEDYPPALKKTSPTRPTA